jgi:LacI family transcriptional regulator
VRATLHDVAREAGVSSATVDRVLNGRPGVRARTRDLVFATARRLAYLAEEAAAPTRADTEPLQLDFVLPAGSNAFIKDLQREIERQARARPRLRVRIDALDGFEPERLAATLRGLRGRTQGIGVIALDHPAVREALRQLAGEGIAIVTIASDIAHVPRIAYVGIDNRAAGRLAGYLVGRFWGAGRAGKVALFAGSLAYRGHEEREMGFRHILAETGAPLEVVALREMLDDRETAYREAAAILDRYPDLAAIYNIGAGITGIAQALQERGRQNAVIFIGHEATEGTKGLLLDGTLDAVIDQNPRVEAREALNILTAAIDKAPFEAHPPRLQAIFRENIPE